MRGSPTIRITAAPRTPPGLSLPARGAPLRSSPPARRSLTRAFSAAGVSSASALPTPPPLIATVFAGGRPHRSLSAPLLERVATILEPPEQALARRVRALRQALADLGLQVASHRLSMGDLCQRFARLAEWHGPGLADAIQALERTRHGAPPAPHGGTSALQDARLWLASLQDLRDLLLLLDPAARVGAPPRLRDDLRSQYAHESRALVEEWLSAAGADRESEVVTYASLIAPGARASFCGPLAPALARRIERHQQAHGQAGLDADRLLLMRLIAHPYSGAFNAIRSLFLLAQADPPLQLHRTLGGLGLAYGATAQAVAAIPGTRVQGDLFKGVVLREGAPWVRSVASAGTPFLVHWPMSTTTRLDQAYLGAFQDQWRGYDGLLRLRGEVAAIRADWFHPPATASQAEALVLPGQRLQVLSQARVRGPHPGGGDYLLIALEPAGRPPARPQAASL